MSKLRYYIEQGINHTSAENGSDTPDFILAEFLTDCLVAFDKTVVARENWYGRACGNGVAINGAPGPAPQPENAT